LGIAWGVHLVMVVGVESVLELLHEAWFFLGEWFTSLNEAGWLGDVFCLTESVDVLSNCGFFAWHF